MIRSATQVTAEVLEAGRDLVVVGRAGIGLDNVDVAEATRRGVMVVNAPQSNILSAAEHTLALLLAQARNVPQAHNDLRGGQVEPLEVGRRRAARQDARHRRPRPRRRPRRAAGAHVRHAPRGVRPVRQRRARPPARRAARADDRGAVRAVRLRLDPRHQDAADHRARERRCPRARQDRAAPDQRGPGRHRRRGRARGGDRARSARRRRDRHLRHGTDHRVAAVRARQRRRHAAPRRVDVRGPGQGRRDDRRAGRARAPRRLRAVRRERRGVGGVRDGAALPPARGAARPVVHRARRRRAGDARDHLRRRDRRLRLPRAHALGAEGCARPDRRRTGDVRQRAATRRGARDRDPRDDVVGRARLRQPDLRARRGRHPRRGDALREAGSAAHRRHRRARRRPAAVAPHARRAQRRRPRRDRSGRHDPRRRRHQHLQHPRRAEPERRGRADGHRDRLARAGRDRARAHGRTRRAVARARSISSSDVDARAQRCDLRRPSLAAASSST